MAGTIQRLLLFVFLTCHLSVSVEMTMMRQYFHVDSRYTDILPTDALLWTRNGTFSLARCALTCSTQSACLSFFFDNDSCHGYSYRMDDLRKQNAAIVLGMSYAEPKGMLGNLALLKPTHQGTYRPALAGDLTSEYAVDGHRWPGIINPPTLCSVSKTSDVAPYWNVDLQQSYVIHVVTILIISKQHNAFKCQRKAAVVELTNIYTTNPIGSITIDVLNVYGGPIECTSHPGPSSIGKTFRELPCNAPILGQIVRISKTEKILTLCEVEVYGTYP